MPPFEQGFIQKCAEAGLNQRQTGFLYGKLAIQVKQAEAGGPPMPPPGAGGPPPGADAGGPPMLPPGAGGPEAGGGNEQELAAILPQLLAMLSHGGAGAGGPPPGAGGPPPGAGGPPGAGPEAGADPEKLKAMITQLMAMGQGGAGAGAGAGGA